MRPNPQFPAALVTFTEEILNGKLHFLCSVIYFFVISIHLASFFGNKLGNETLYIMQLV